jgi:two-component system, sensor histidine kinase
MIRNETSATTLNSKSEESGEQARLKALYEYEILDTDPEKEFDDLARLAAEICDAPISRINLIDESRQWSKSIYGMPSSSIEIPRKLTACQYTIEQSEPLEIQDLKTDIRFEKMPYVDNYPYLRYYLGAPLLNPGGHAIGALCVLDYKPRKLSEKQKRQLQILASEVMARFELRRQNIKLQMMTRHKTQLMKMLSHDMRSPLNGIIGMSSILNEQLENDDELEMLDIIQQSAIQLNQMIDEVLHYSLIESTGFDLEQTKADILQIADDVEKLYKPAAANKSIDLSFRIDTTDADIYLDEGKFEQIMGNLISNAIKFTENGGNVLVSVDVHPIEGHNHLVLKVKDSGRGITDDKIENLFENKLKSEGGTLGEKGTGLGLSIIKHFVDLHDGNIEVSSVRGLGTEFTISLPVTKG